MKSVLVPILTTLCMHAAAAEKDPIEPAWPKTLEEKKLVMIAKMAESTKNLDMAHYVHGQLLMLGSQKFDDKNAGVQYFMLRMDPEKPSCHREAIGKKTTNLNEIHPPLSCDDKYQIYYILKSHLTPELREFRHYETSFFQRNISPYITTSQKP